MKSKSSKGIVIGLCQALNNIEKMLQGETGCNPEAVANVSIYVRSWILPALKYSIYASLGDEESNELVKEFANKYWYEGYNKLDEILAEIKG